MEHKAKNHILCLMLTCALMLPQMLHAAIGDWTIYSSFRSASKVVEMNKVLYVLSNGRLYSYDPEDTSVETYDKSRGLNSSTIFDILPCTSDHVLAIVYTDGNIDLMDSNGDVYNMPELQQKNLADKTINDAMVDGSTLYLSTGSGIVVVDVHRHVVTDFYNFGHNVKSIAIEDGIIYAVCADGVFTGNTADNLLDKSTWVNISKYAYTHVINLDGHFFVYSNSLFSITNKKTFSTKSLAKATIRGWNIIDDKLYVYATGNLYIVDKDGNMTTIATTDVNYMIPDKATTYWVASETTGLYPATLADGAVTPTASAICPDGPWSPHSYHLTANNGRLLMTGGAFNYPAVTYDGAIMQYENERWTHFDEQGPIDHISSKYYVNVVDVVEDPLDPSHHFVSAASSGLYEFKDYKFVRHYSYDDDDCTLGTILPSSSNAAKYVRVTGLAFDASHNLWMLNNEKDTVVHILKNDGKWTCYHYPEIEGFPTFDHIRFDQRGWAWINSRRTTEAGHLAGFLVINTNGTINQISDDKHKFVSSFTNQDGTSYAPTLLNDIVEDLDGGIWLATNLGPFVIYEPSTVFNANFTVSQVKVPRNDGSNLADYLLNGVAIKCIAIDGGNRKWFGTSGNGIYLVSSDGTEILHHFTVENSPLISDEIYDIAIDGSNGEVFIATALGLVSYRGDATDPMPELTESDVRVYPNPVRPDHTGPITVTGLMSQTDVKIVNAAGRLVNQGTSTGGEYTWDGCTSDGSRAASGIYFVFAADKEGNKGVAAKFLMVK